MKFQTTILLGMLTAMSACQKVDLGEKEGKTSQEPSSPTLSVDDNEQTVHEDIQDEYIIGGHVAIFEDRDPDTEDRFVFVSLKEWYNVPSANSEITPELAREIAESYKEGNLTGWRIPTKAEAEKLRSFYGDAENLEAFNTILEKAEGISIFNTDTKGKNIRYLCEDGYYSFCFKKGTSITAAGAKTEYSLRLLKDSIIANK